MTVHRDGYYSGSNWVTVCECFGTVLMSWSNLREFVEVLAGQFETKDRAMQCPLVSNDRTLQLRHGSQQMHLSFFNWILLEVGWGSKTI